MKSTCWSRKISMQFCSCFPGFLIHNSHSLPSVAWPPPLRPSPTGGSSGCKIAGPVCGAYLFRNSSNAAPRGKRPGHDIARKRLGFHDRDIRFAGNGEEIIGRAAAHETSCSVMIGQRDLVHCFSIDAQRPNPTTNKGARFNRSTQADDANEIAIVDLELGSRARAKFRRTFPAAIPRDD